MKLVIEMERLKYRMPAQIRWSDVDQFGHVNNSVYFSLYDLAKTSYLRDVVGVKSFSDYAIVVANINANFFIPIFFNEEVVIETSVIQLGNKSFTLLQRVVDPVKEEIKCECRTVMVYFDLKKAEPTPLLQEHKEAICRYEGKTLEELGKH